MRTNSHLEFVDRTSVGIHLEGTEAHVACSSTDGSKVPQFTLPPSVLLPRLTGELIEVDVNCPPRVRGSGITWPDDGMVDTDRGCGRFPVAYAWPLMSQRVAVPWKWKPDERHPRHAEPWECVAATTSCICAQLDQCRQAPGESDVALIVPDWFDSAKQQSILDSRALRGANVQFLWRPVAGALAWIAQYSADLKSAAGTLGSVLSIHLGVDGFEASVLQLIRDDRYGIHVLPARRRPTLPPLPWAGVVVLEHLAEAVTAASGRKASPATIWRLMWASPWPRLVARQLHGLLAKDQAFYEGTLDAGLDFSSRIFEHTAQSWKAITEPMMHTWAPRNTLRNGITSEVRTRWGSGN